MPLTLPNLDDRRWADLMDEGRSLLPLYAPDWTDHNLHDPGITLLELFAWVAEMDLYRINRIPDAHRRKFLALVGFTPRPPAGARLAAGVQLAEDGGGPLTLPAGVEIEAQTPGGAAVSYLTEEPLVAIPGALAAIHAGGDSGLTELTAAWRRGEAVEPLGGDPTLGSALYLSFSQAPPVDVPWSLYFAVEGGGPDSRQRILDRQREREDCRPSPPCCCDGDCGCPEAPTDEELADDALADDEVGDRAVPLPHHSARTVWEIATESGDWRPLDPAAGEVTDHTRAFTLAGRVIFRLPSVPAGVRLGEQSQALPALRCRLTGGALDAPPRLSALLLNGVVARQETPVASTWTLAPGATVIGPDPTAGETAQLDAKRDPQGRITTLFTSAAEAPAWRVLAFQAATPTLSGHLIVEAVELAAGTGRPHQPFELPSGLPAGGGMRLVSREETGWRRWQLHDDLDASRRGDAHAVLEPGETPADPYRLRVGDGERGRTVPRGARLLAGYHSTLGSAGLVEADALSGLADSPRNRALLGDVEVTAARIAALTNPLPSSGACDGESLSETAARAQEAALRSERAVTAGDHERLALATPGVELARAEARVDRHPAFPCFSAPGVTTVLLLPRLPAERPRPSAGLLAAVSGYLGRRRVLGSRVEVAGPTYVPVRVRTTVQACPGSDPQALSQRLDAALDAFFHPLTGGPEGGGWPFGRSVYAAEVYQVLDETAGVDGVLSLELIGGDGKASCDNLCLPPDGLVAAGHHEITVEGGGASSC